MLSNIQERVERSVFHALMGVTVEEGFTPDLSLFDLENADLTIASQEQNAYETALKNVQTLKGFSIEIFGASSNQAKGDKKVPRIVIDTTSYYQGELGVDTTESYVPAPGGFNVLKPSDSLLTDYQFGIKLISNRTNQTRALHAILTSALPRRGYIKWYDEADLLPSENIHIRFLSSFEHNLLPEGIIEKTYRFEIVDLHEILDKVVRQVAPINEINADMIDIDNALIITTND